MKKTFLFFLAFLLPLLSSCALIPEEEIPPEVSVVEGEESLYTFAEVMVGDVSLYFVANAKYSPSVSEDLSFDVNGMTIAGVYVQAGDNVQQGQLLAELDTEDLVKKHDSAAYELSSLEAQLDHLTALYNLDIERFQLQLSSATDESVKASINTKIDERKQTYEQDKEILEINISAKEELVAELNSDIESRKLYAGIDGTVTKVQMVTETSVSQAGVVFITVSDSTSSLFIVSGDEATELSVGDAVSVEIDTESYSGTVTYVSGSETGDQKPSAYVSLDDKSLTFENGCKAKISKSIDERHDVLCVNASAVRSDDSGYFVFVLNEDEIRTKHYIEVGLIGNDYYEIVSGLSEGDLVILE